MNPPEKIVDKIEKLPLIQFGAKRNNGQGIVKLVDHLEIEFKDIELPDKASHLTLISPWMYIEKFVHRYDCRYATEIMWNNRKKNILNIIPNGQFFRIKSGKNIQSIARKGLLRKHLFQQFGYGEFVLNDWNNNQKGEAE